MMDQTAETPTAAIIYTEAFMGDEQRMRDEELKDLVCPDCQAKLSRRRTRNPDACEMLCGGCGQVFDVCDLDTVEKLKKGSTP